MSPTKAALALLFLCTVSALACSRRDATPRAPERETPGPAPSAPSAPSAVLKNGREARVTMHVLEGSKEEIEKQLRTSLEAFFDLYPEI